MPLRVNLLCWPLAAILSGSAAAQQPAKPFTLRQILSAPFASELTAAPVGSRFAWVENAEGVRNLWVGGTNETAHAVTHYTEDDGQQISGLAWSPDGKWIAFAHGAEDGVDGKPANPAELQPGPSQQVWVVSTGTDGRNFPMPDGHSPMFTRDGKNMLWIHDGKICLLPSPFLVKNDGAFGPPQLVFDRGNASQTTLSPDGKLLAYVSTRQSNGRSHSFIGVFDMEKRTLHFVSPGTGVDSAPAWSPDGKQIAWLRAPFTDAAEFTPQRTSPNPWQLMVADTASIVSAQETDSREARVVFEPEANKPGSVLPHMSTGGPKVWWALGGKELVFASEADGWVHLYAVDANATLGKAKLLTPGEYEIEEAQVTPRGDAILFASNEWRKDDYDDPGRRHNWSVVMAEGLSTQLSSGHGIETHPVIATDGTIAALVSDARTPLYVALITKAGTITPLHPDAVPSSYPGPELVTPEQVLFPSAVVAADPILSQSARKSGPPSSATTLQIHGQLFLPPQATAGSSTALRNDKQEKHPAILFLHGGPRRQMLLGYPAMEYYSNAYAMNEYLASRGFIVLSVNYRCGIGYGLDFRECEHGGAAGASEYNDVLAAWQYLKSRGDVDMKRIGIWGGSYGGYLTALALARNSDKFAAGVDFHGVHDWTLEDNAGDWLRGTNAEKDRIAAIARASSPIADVAKWKSPVLLIHGDDDPEVAYAQTPVLAEALRARGVHVEEMIFPDEVHSFLLHKDWLAACERATEFFERELQEK
jgi:dipeptidyl aminopeptidase/acylaminoacyl peptidase